MCAKEQSSQPHADDVWEDDSDNGTHAEHEQLNREWEARHQQYYNSGYREGLDEGKELTLQLGFNTGFSEGAAAGFEFGVMQGALHTLAAMITTPQSTVDKIQELLQQVKAVPNRAAMRDTCMSIMEQPVAGAAADELQQALQQLQLEDGLQAPDVSAATAQPSQQPSSSDQTLAGSSSSSSRQQPGLTSPQQLVHHVQEELRKLGFSLTGTPTPAAADKDRAAEAAARIAAAAAAAPTG